MKTMIALICFTALAGCALDGGSLPVEGSEAQELGSPMPGPAVPNVTNVWLFCEHTNLTGLCFSGPARLPTLGYPFNDNISSIQTNGTAMETWNDANFKGTYGYFAPGGTWLSLSSPYNDAISSVSYPGA